MRCLIAIGAGAATLLSAGLALAGGQALNPAGTDAVAFGRLTIRQTPGIPGLQVPVLAGTPTNKQDGDHWCEENGRCCVRAGGVDLCWHGTPVPPTSTPTHTPTPEPTDAPNVSGVEYAPQTVTSTPTITPVMTSTPTITPVMTSTPTEPPVVNGIKYVGATPTP